MSKQTPSGKCVYCLESFDSLTWDHVFPLSWYPNTTPSNLEKWKVPACKKCNKDYSKIEEDLLIRLGLCIDPNDAKSSGIADKVLRSINPICARNRRDRRIRERKRTKIMEQTHSFTSIPNEGIFPNFGPQSNVYYPQYLSILISDKNLRYFGEKLVRGMTYITNNSFIEKDYEIQIHFVRDSDATPFVSLVNKYGYKHNRGPGIVIERAQAHNDIKTALFTIEIWGKLRMYASVEKK
jgi:hypothetical protein